MKLDGFTNSGIAVTGQAIMNLARKNKLDRDVFWKIVNGIQPDCQSLDDLTPASMFDLLVKLGKLLYK